MGGHRFSVLAGRWAIVRLAADAAVPSWALGSHAFVSITRTRDELSIVCPAEVAPADGKVEADWAALKLEGPFPFDQVGVLSSVVTPLARAGISVFAISTFDTDYVLVKAGSMTAACGALIAAGHEFVPE